MGPVESAGTAWSGAGAEAHISKVLRDLSFHAAWGVLQ